jgi:hypothetical protein
MPAVATRAEVPQEDSQSFNNKHRKVIGQHNLEVFAVKAFLGRGYLQRCQALYFLAFWEDLVAT